MNGGGVLDKEKDYAVIEMRGVGFATEEEDLGRLGLDLGVDLHFLFIGGFHFLD